MINRFVIILILTLIGGSLGFLRVGNGIDPIKSALIHMLLSFIISSFIVLIEFILVRKGTGKQALFAFFGLVAGLITSSILSLTLLFLFDQKMIFNISMIFLLAFSYMGFIVGWIKGEEIELINVKKRNDKKITYNKILDTSVIIDGRISDIAETGFLEGDLIVPKFVLKELQQVADSPDPLKRSRGRRGLDILNTLRQSKKTIIRITDEDFLDVKEVDNKLLKLAKQISGIIITNDYNLNKIAEFQGVRVLNVNELSNAVKPIVLPNEELRINIVKEGKDQKQGIAYLDDGTMIVIDNGKDKIGQEVNVIVTSILQTPAGRMIFTQLSEDKQRVEHENFTGINHNHFNKEVLK